MPGTSDYNGAPAAALNPTPYTINLPQGGSLFTDSSPERGALYIDTGTGGHSVDLVSTLLTQDERTSAGNYGAQVALAHQRLLSQYGVNIDNLPSVNMGDFLSSKNHDPSLQTTLPSTGYAFSPGNLSLFAQARPAPLTQQTENTLSNAPATPAQIAAQKLDPNYVQGAPAAPNNGGSQQIDYTLHPGETISQYNARIAAANPNLPAPGTTSPTGVTNTAQAAPQPTSIPSVITPPTASGSFTPPPASAPQVVTDYVNSLAGSLAAAVKQLSDTNTSKIAAFQSQIDALNKDKESALATEGAIVNSEAQDKAAALRQEQQQYQDNYNAVSALAAKANALVDSAAQVTQQLENTTGLASIMNPRISKAASDLTAELAVIKGAVDIYNGQIGSAQAQLVKATDAISSIYGDQISYYNAVIAADKADITSLSSDQKAYIDSQIKQLEGNVTNAQNSANIIRNAMLDPTKALAIAQAGVTLNDTPEQIAGKLASFQYSQELSDTSQKMAQSGYSTTPISGVTPVTIIDSLGNKSNWYKEQTTGGFTIGSTRFDAQGNVVATAPTTTDTNNTKVGTALSDAQAAIAGGADPDKVKQAFLAGHPTSGSEWTNYFTDANGSVSYPKPPAQPKSGIFGLGFLGL